MAKRIDPKKIAVIGGRGALPHLLKRVHPEVYLIGIGQAVGDDVRFDAIVPLEKFGEIFARLNAMERSCVVFAGGLARPRLDPAKFDDVMRTLAPGLMAAMHYGDDHVLRHIIGVFADRGLETVGADVLCPELALTAGVFAGPRLDERQLADVARGMVILEHMSALDIGQAVVVENGQCLGLETVQGTDAMLRAVAYTTSELRDALRGGALVKCPKPTQDLRVDMPAIGPETVRAAADAGLSVIAAKAHQTLLLEQDQVAAMAEQLLVTICGVE